MKRKQKKQHIEPGHENDAVVYVRVSTKDQEKGGFSIPAQYKFLREYAEQKGLNVLHEFEDEETAKQSGREQFGQMLEFLEDNASCRNLIVEKTDRLYRNIDDFAALDKFKLNVHLVKENQVMTAESRSHEKFFHLIKFGMAKNYVDNLSEEVKKGLKEKASQGYWPTHAPIGYLNSGKDEFGKNTIAPDPERAEIVKKLFEIYAEGVFSFRELAKMARNMGLTFRKSKKPITTAGIHYMLKSQIYTGHFVYNKITYKGNYQPLITQELFDAVQTARSEKNQNKHKNSKNEFAYSHTLRCGHCGCSIIGEIKNGYLIYYHCTGYKQKCPDPYARQEILETHFLEELSKIIIDEDIAKLIIESLEQSQSETEKFKAGSITRLKEQLTSLTIQRHNLLNLKLENRVDDSTYDQKYPKLTKDINEIETNIHKLESSKKTGIESVKALLKHLPQIKDSFKNLSPLDKRKLVNLVFIGSTWKAGTLSTKPKSPFDEIALYNKQNPCRERENPEVLVKTHKWLGD